MQETAGSGTVILHQTIQQALPTGFILYRGWIDPHGGKGDNRLCHRFTAVGASVVIIPVYRDALAQHIQSVVDGFSYLRILRCMGSQGIYHHRCDIQV